MAIDANGPSRLPGTFLLCWAITGCAASSTSVVAVPVADVRAQPGSRPQAGSHDPLQETQVLYGERVRVRTQQGSWALVEAVEQPEFTHHKSWEGYPGWVAQEALQPRAPSWNPTVVVSARWATIWRDASASGALMRLPMGAALMAANTDGIMWQVRLVDGSPAWISPGEARRLEELQRMPVDRRRRDIVRAAEAFLGDLYFWGGRSPMDTAYAGATGVDCSGLVNLAYRTAGITIPRDAHEQYLRTHPVAQPQEADLIFLSSPDDPRTITHVMLYAGDGWLIEGPGTGRTVRRISVEERLGAPVEQLASGQRIGTQYVYLGAFLPENRRHLHVVFGPSARTR